MTASEQAPEQAPNELHFMPAAELADRIRRRELSPVEVMDAFLDRIERRNPVINAFIYQRFDEARDSARAAERDITSGAELGAFHGVPTAMKDLFDFKPGWVSTMGGVRALADFTPDFSCLWAERMERAGAIIVGKTNAPVLGLRGTTDNPMFGPSRNPFDTARNPGGSSGGSAAAVADGMVPFAEGTDAGGSIRVPSSWCGLYGFKPSAGRVPAVIRPNAFGGVGPFVHEGTITRNVRDAAIGLNVMSGFHAGDPFSAGRPSDFTPHLGRSVRGWRIAYSPDFGAYPVDPEVAKTVAQAVLAFEEAGATVEQVEIDLRHSHTELTAMFNNLIAVQNMETVENLKSSGIDLIRDHPDDLPREIHESVATGYRLTALDLSRAQLIRSQVFDTIQDVFGNYDLLVTPTVGVPAVLNTDDGDTKGPTHVNGEPVDPLLGWCLTYLINLTGHPAASIPAGLTAAGLPVGMQIIGRRRDDGDVLAASAAFEALRPWHHTYPGLQG
ncbi:amidase/aspartyl-tRNA(Asn)/glutamyl-tRNA(Gln) amidotransferase subunit A [Sinosporangium album]|uniref:Amidase/aspartyl-tRNA(Asn)/glutamyl-tRNA(Gln) amidotransferase subunit A n=1 Tax=Sinosporangium album TaxID=504805 RepID=A0A1G8BLZ2_9ACTN|nr:amidase [Sinosporangium album]SDH34245.1 amidase/aspartyl-tRNA(Asn)/glutamyl-tRNA(Gln) amidotransferase subunit A [Sinosporangium album]